MSQRKCPVIEIIEVIGGKWKIPILWCIGQAGIIRYNELRREVTGITNTMLTRSLDSLIAHNLVTRKDFSTIPPKVEYSLTKDGEELFPLLEQLVKWIKALEL
jgi:DNA-binding HxlR family transcriptional regulator